MRFYKLFMVLPVVCLLALFVSAPVQAQLQEVVDDYCEEVSDNVIDTLKELGDASEDLADCHMDLTECMLGQGLFYEPSRCIKSYGQCSKLGARDQKQACEAFLLEWGNDTRRAEKDAEREDVLHLFLNWAHDDDPNPVDDPTRDECLNEAEDLAVVCKDQQIGD